MGRDGHDDVSMALEDLHDLPALQVPQVYLAVLAARHDPFAARDAEAGGDAVLGVLVADVRLEAARGLEVPQPYRAVVGGGEDVFRVGRKLDVLANGVVSLGECLEALPRWQSPYADEAVKRTRDDERSVPVKMHGSHIVDMSVQGFGASSLGRIPDLHVAVTSARHELRALCVVVDTEYVTGVSLEDFAG